MSIAQHIKHNELGGILEYAHNCDEMSSKVFLVWLSTEKKQHIRLWLKSLVSD